MTLDPRTPVIVGVGQTLNRPSSVATTQPPAELMAEALRRAAADTGSGDTLVRTADSVRTVEQMSWRYGNVGAEVARLVGAHPRETVVTTVGGNSPQMLVNATARDIAAGRLDRAVLCGAEAIYSRRLARQTGERLPWPDVGEAESPDVVLGSDRPGTSDKEQARSLILPVQIYPIFESALRAASGESVAHHQVKISELWARFSAVAAGNPYAWSPQPRTAEEIRTVTPDNRMVAFPYPKLMNANIQTDQGAAVIICSVEAAEGAGVPRERWVFPHAGAEAHDHWFVSERWDLCSSPAIQACGAAVFRRCGIGPDDLSYVDVYSCFPSAVQIGATALGLPLADPARPLTLTGGLAFAGGPGNNYSMHAIATMAGALRSEPGAWGFVSALGWYATKHSVGVYSSEPPARAFTVEDVQDEVDRLPSRGARFDYAGRVTIEASTVVHERDGQPSLGIVACLTPDGERAWANTRDPALMRALMGDDVAGESAVLEGEGLLKL